MAENIDDDVNCIEELKSIEHMTVNIFANDDAIRQLNTNNEIENNKTQRILQVQNTVTGINSTRKRCYMAIAVCMGLLCVLLLTGIAALWIKLNNLDIENNQLQTSHNNLTVKNKQLQTSYNNLTIENNQLQNQKESFLKKLTIMGWTLFQSRLYYISTEMKNWTGSREDCRKRGADLVIINSTEEEAFVEMLNKKRGNYIGLSDREREAVWKWVDGTPLTAPYWSSGNYFSDLDDCVVAGLNGSTGWYDRPCTEMYYWICE